GAVGRRWIRLLVEKRNAGEELGRKEYAELCTSMRNGFAVPNKPRQFDRVAKHFALIATGGELAINAGLLPLNAGAAIEAATYALRAWAMAKADFEMEPHARMLRQVRHWINAMMAADRI